MESAAGGVMAADLGRPIVAPRARRARLFYPGLAVVMLAVVFAGFAPTYYLKAAYGTKPLPLLFHVHGAAFTSWMLLLIVQTALVASGRTPLHRRLGVAGGWLAATMTVLAWMMAVDSARRAGNDATSLGFVTVPMGTVVVFPALVGAALVWRRFPATHKRLMMIATTELMAAGIGRLPGVIAYGALGFFGGTDLVLVALLIHDRVTTGRFHPATLWGGGFLIASQVLRVFVGGTDAWLTLTRWLTA
jgi:hypothetical protein